MDRESTFGLKSEQLARLLAIGAPSAEGSESAARRTASPAGEALRALMEEPFRAGAGESPVSDWLFGPRVDLPGLRRLKEQLRKRAERAKEASEAEHAAATAAYFAVIARATLAGERDISRHSDQALARAFATLSEKPWVPPELRELLSNARAELRRKT